MKYKSIRYLTNLHYEELVAMWRKGALDQEFVNSPGFLASSASVWPWARPSVALLLGVLTCKKQGQTKPVFSKEEYTGDFRRCMNENV